jgi:hypothetical protein
VALTTPMTGLLSEMDSSSEHRQAVLHEVMYGIDDLEAFSSVLLWDSKRGQWQNAYVCRA